MKLKNIIKFLILSATLSNTCLFAARLCHIDWGFSDSHGHFGNLNKYDVLCFRFTCEDDYEGKEHYPRAEYECFVRPVNAQGKEIAWSEFTSEAERRTAGASNVPGDNKDKGKDKKFYGISVPSGANSDWSTSLFFRMSNDQNGFKFHCGSFFIRLDEHGKLHLGGGEKRDILVLGRKRDKDNHKGFPNIPFFFDDKTSLVGNTLIIEDANVLGNCNPVHPGTFTNKGTISFDNIIWRGLTVENEGKIFARNLILDKSILNNKGEIRWSDNFDLYRNSQVNSGDAMCRGGASANRTLKITPKCGTDDIGWLSWSAAGGEGIKFPKMPSRVTVYVTGEYTGKCPCSGICFSETTEGLRHCEVNEEKDKTRNLSALAHHKQVEVGKALYVGLAYNSRLCWAVKFDPKKSGLYIVFEDEAWDKDRFGK